MPGLSPLGPARDRAAQKHDDDDDAVAGGCECAKGARTRAPALEIEVAVLGQQRGVAAEGPARARRPMGWLDFFFSRSESIHTRARGREMEM